MPKKQILILTIVIVAVCLLVVFSGWFIWQNFIKTSSSPSTTVAAYTTEGPRTLTPKASDNISLEPKAKQNNGGLQVNNNPNTSANLGSGQRQIESYQNNNQPSVPGPETFGEFKQYKDANEVYFVDLQVGNGAEVVAGSSASVLYKGWLTSGKLFDQSRADENGNIQPLDFSLGAGQLIPGFEQGVAGMKAGGVRRVIIPPSLGYGDKPQGTSIPANSVLVFDIQLLAVE